MKEYLITFSNGKETKTVRRYLSPEFLLKTEVWIATKKTDSKGVYITDCQEIKGITAKDFMPSLI